MHGKVYEKKAKYYICKTFSTFDFRDVGLVINPFFPYLGASPDGLLCGEDVMLVEVKCIFNKDRLNLSELCLKADFCLRDNGDETYSLKENHQYFFQIQGQME